MINTRFIQNENISLREEDEDGALLFEPDTGKIVVLNLTGVELWPDTGKIVVLNLTGVELWKRLKEPNDIKSLKSYIIENFSETDNHDVEKEINEFITQLKELEFIKEIT
ncbi:MAG: PqqD family protein [Deltaproteobacteria bacterium]|nr:PqqD family protein [Deltaproteobacteria bacterium]